MIRVAKTCRPRLAFSVLTPVFEDLASNTVCTPIVRVNTSPVHLEASQLFSTSPLSAVEPASLSSRRTVSSLITPSLYAGPDGVHLDPRLGGGVGVVGGHQTSTRAFSSSGQRWVDGMRTESSHSGADKGTNFSSSTARDAAAGGVSTSKGDEEETKEPIDGSTSEESKEEDVEVKSALRTESLRAKSPGGYDPSQSMLSIIRGNAKSLLTFGVKLLPRLIVGTKNFAIGTLKFLFTCVTNPRLAWDQVRTVWGHIKDEAKHYWLGFKLLWAEVQTSAGLLMRVVQGYPLTRRERKQLVRTSVDLFRLIPFAIFIVVPFMEFLLPVALKVFPNMLPSTFQDEHKRAEKLRHQLKLRISMAEYLQDTVEEMARKADKKNTDGSVSASELLDLFQKIREGREVSTDSIVTCAKMFKDELMLDNTTRPQLVGMARYMGLQPYGTDAFLRYQIRRKIRDLKQDDQAILWEGVESLTREELKLACEERGMRASGLSKEGYRRQLRQWLDLSVNSQVPIALLILSRSFTIGHSVDEPVIAIQDAVSSMDEEVLNAAVLEAVGSGDAGDKGDKLKLRELQLETLEYENELIEDERVEAARTEGLSSDRSSERKEEPDEETKQDDLGAILDSEAKAAADKETEDRRTVAADTAAQARQEELKDTAPGAEVEDEYIPELDADALETLGMMTSSSSVEKERKAVEKLKMSTRAREAKKVLEEGRIGGNVVEDTSASLVNARLDRILGSLEAELASVDESIGDEYNILDLDKDGVVSREELEIAVKSLLHTCPTDEEARQIVSRQLDREGTGSIRVKDLIRLGKKARAERELNDLDSDASAWSSSETDEEVVAHQTAKKHE